MNVYDFDGTIYFGDSSIDFYFYCLCRQPRIAKYIFCQILGILQYIIGMINLTQMKEKFFSFLLGLENTEEIVTSFWEKNGKMKKWYLEHRQETDIIISASPEFLLRPICLKLGIKPPIGTKMDIKSGKIYGLNCKGLEKVARFSREFPTEIIEEFFSDSRSDDPLAYKAQKAFLVKGEVLFPWPQD